MIAIMFSKRIMIFQESQWAISNYSEKGHQKIRSHRGIKVQKVNMQMETKPMCLITIITKYQIRQKLSCTESGAAASISLPV